MSDTRACWDDVWMGTAALLSRRSSDPRMKVGCVIVTFDNQRIVSLGYNGLERGGSNVVDSDVPGQSGCIHAENNALLRMDYSDSVEKKIYLTLSPCKLCCRLIVNAGTISELIYCEPYRDMSGIDILRSAGISVRQFTSTSVYLRGIG